MRNFPLVSTDARFKREAALQSLLRIELKEGRLRQQIWAMRKRIWFELEVGICAARFENWTMGTEKNTSVCEVQQKQETCLPALWQVGAR